jgi:hypothetical protein
MTRRTLPVVVLALAGVVTASGCHVRAARGSTAPPAADGGAKAGARKPKTPAATDSRPAPDAGTPAGGDDEVVDLSEPVMGLTRAQVRTRRGPPTEVRGNEWIYTPEQEGCRDVIISDVLTFKGGVVVKLRLQRRQTGKVCSRRQILPRSGGP